MKRDELKKSNLLAAKALPQAARRWLDNVLPENVVISSRIVIGQEGKMDIRGR